MNLSSKLAQLRRQMGWSQDELASELDVSRQAVYKWENAQSRPDTDKLMALSKIFNISLDNLLDDESEIVHRAEPTKKLAYGEITVKQLPTGMHGSDILYTLTEEEKKTVGKFNAVLAKWYKFVWVMPILFLIGGFFMFLLGDLPEFVITLMGIVLIVGVPVTFGYPIAKFFSKKIFFSKYKSDIEHTVYLAKKAEQEDLMASRGYKSIQLLPYVLEWAFGKK